MDLKQISIPLAFCIVVASVYFAIHAIMPQHLSKNDILDNGFKLKNAYDHIETMASVPHFTGTKAHKNTQNYIIKELKKLELQPQVQNNFPQTIGINKKWNGAVNTQNIIAKINGTNSAKALLLLSHYDSAVHSAIGASDAASGVAVILETLRIYLKSGQKPKNDIIILFTDAEEIGLLGASTFVNEHPWAKNIGLVLNFEARGSGGPSYMLLETNGGNKNLIEHFRAAKTPYPVANSLVYSIYKMLPNDTDLTIFRENADIDGFNFAFIDDHYDYHTAQDKPSRLDTNTLAHQATYLWPLLTYFSNADLGTLKADSELAYVTLPYFGLISYPFSWVSPMTFGLTIIFFAIVFIGIIRGKLQLKPILTGFLPMCLFLALSGLMAYFGWQFITYIHPQYHDILHGFTYNGHWYIAAFISLTIALGMLIYNLYFKKYSVRNLFVAPLFLWLVINCILAIYLPGAGFFSITVIIGLFYLSVYIFKEKLRYRPLWFSLLSVPVLFIFVPLIVMFPVALGLKMLFISTIFTSLIFVIMSPVFSSFIPQKTGKLFLFLSILLFITASFKSGYTVDRKKPNSLIYILDTDKNKAYWVSYDHTLDDYTKQALGNKPLNGSYDSLTITSKYRTQIKWHIETKPKRIIEPSIKILSDTIIGNNRRINITIAPQRSVNRIELFTVQPLTFSEFTVNGKPYPENKKENYVLKTTKTHNQLINYYFTESNEQLRLQIAIDKNQKPDLMLYEVSYDLLESMQFNLTPRSEEMMTKPFVVNDAIIVKKRISFE